MNKTLRTLKGKFLPESEIFNCDNMPEDRLKAEYDIGPYWLPSVYSDYKSGKPFYIKRSAYANPGYYFIRFYKGN